LRKALATAHRASLGQPVLAAADGIVRAAVDCFPDDNRHACPAHAYPRGASLRPAGDPANRNLVCVEHTSGEDTCYLHLKQHSLTVVNGAEVRRGTKLGEVGGTGAKNVHLHFAASDRSEASAPGQFSDLVTFPVAFTDYFASDDGGRTWAHVGRGTPRAGQWVKRGQR
jgi:murein DD-endopeptidase MepM/ murein hydrolase activator NlpD